jgi:hypothetical protein
MMIHTTLYEDKNRNQNRRKKVNTDREEVKRKGINQNRIKKENVKFSDLKFLMI